VFNDDGCQNDCTLEDPTVSEWLCTEDGSLRTSCCKFLINPEDANKTCTCAGIPQVSQYYRVTPNCEKLDIDECSAATVCHPNAICENVDGRLGGVGYNCYCPAGMRGDAVATCDVYEFSINFVILLNDVLPADLDLNAVSYNLLISNALPSTITLDQININASMYSPIGSFGTLLQVHITCPTENYMYDNTPFVDLSKLGITYSTIQDAQSTISTIDNSFGAVSTMLAGFAVDSVTWDVSNNRWIVNTRYVNDLEDTVTGMYLSKVGAAPYSSDTLDTFFVSQHPCTDTFSVCCMLHFRDHYITGVLGQNITDKLGTCGNDIQAMDTNNLFNNQQNDYLIDNLFANYPTSSVHRASEQSVQLIISNRDLIDSFSTQTPVMTGLTTGKKYQFFVGMSYFKLLPTNAMSTTASQTQVTVVVTDGLTFSFAAEQGYTFVNYITMSLYQNKYVGSLVVRYLQFVKVGVVLPAGIQQNMDSGLIPLSSIRFAVATKVPDQGNDQLWVNPCYSSGDNAMWDISQTWRSIYANGAAQQCATQHNMCTNPVGQILQTNLVEFFFPIGDHTINDTHINSPTAYFIFVYFDLSVVDSNGRNSVSRLFAQAPITALSLSKACESIEVAVNLMEASVVNLAIGMGANSADWASSVKQFDDVIQQNAADPGVFHCCVVIE
jgi:hypothetical protein